MSKKKSILILLVAIVLSVGITFFTTSFKIGEKIWQINQQEVKETSILSQQIVDVLDNPKLIHKLYYRDSFVGVITDMDTIDTLLRRVELTKYKEEFPDSKVELGEDLYIVEEKSYFLYEDIDSTISEYIELNDLFSIEVDKVIFSNGAVIYVKDIADFEAAKEQYLLNFIDKTELDLLQKNTLPPEIVGYGSRSISIKTAETTIYTKGYTSISNIYMNKSEIIEFLSYGYGTEFQIYTVKEYDTIEGVGSKTGLTAQQVVTINSDKLVSTDQLLKVGTKLNVTYFNSPISVIVEKEVVVSEPIYPPEPIYVEDPSLREGLTKVEIQEENGYEQVKYKETYINGVLQEGAEELSRVEVKSYTQGRIYIGTMVIPNVGSGSFRYPIDNVTITCRWYCYSGHTAIDLQNAYNRYGSVYAADRGVVVETGYNAVNGYYIWINHNNGFRTYYGHMNQPAFYDVGVTVAKGEVIGQIGRTGVATGPHVHFVIEYEGVRYNPCIYLGC